MAARRGDAAAARTASAIRDVPARVEMRDLFFVRPDVVNFNASYGTPVREVRTAALAKARFMRDIFLRRGDLETVARRSHDELRLPRRLRPPSPEARNHRTSRPSPPDRRALALTARLEA